MSDLKRLSQKSASQSTEATEVILSDNGDSLDLVAKTASEFDRHGFPRSLWMLDIRGLFESRGERAHEAKNGWLGVRCPWAGNHSTIHDRAFVKVAVPERRWKPLFRCFHRHCAGRDTKAVVEFFGPEIVAKFCGHCGQGETARPETDDA